MGKHRITRKQMKKDEFVSTVTKASMYIEEHWKLFAYGGAVIAGVALIAYLTVLYAGYRTEKGSDILNAGLESFHAPVNPGPDAKLPPSTRTFATDDEKYREALKSFETVINSYSHSRSGILALYYSGLCQMSLGKYDEAISRLGEFIRKGKDSLTIDLAKSSLAQCYFLKKDYESSAKVWKELSDNSLTLYPRDEALLNLARALESQGKNAEAIEIYRRIVMEYPGTASYQEAASKLQG